MAKKIKNYITTTEIADHMLGLKKDILLLQEEYDNFASMLLTLLKKKGERSAGIFFIAQRQILKIVNENAALVWATDKNVMKLDTTKAMKIIKREFSVPAFFQVIQREYITSKTSKEE